MKSIKIVALSLLMFLTLGMGNVSYVAAFDGPIVPCGTGNPKESACTICDLAAGINNIMKFITGIIAYAAAVIVVVAGIIYIVSSGNPQMTSMAKSAIKNAAIGLVIVITAFLIVHFIILAIVQGDTNTVGKGEVTTGGMSTSSWTFTCQ
jgi:hypothetical protein